MTNYTRTMKKGERGFFAFADLYGGGGQAFISVLYLFFLTNVIGLRPSLAGVVILISEIWDAISDPLMGLIGDNTRSKMGRRRPYVLAGGCLLAVAFALAFLPVTGWSQQGKFIYCATAEEKVCHYIAYMASELGFAIDGRQDVYSSDSPPFADKGVPAVNLIRFGVPGAGYIHNRHDNLKSNYLSAEALDITLQQALMFAKRVDGATLFPIERKVSDEIVKKVDEYLFKKKDKK